MIIVNAICAALNLIFVGVNLAQGNLFGVVFSIAVFFLCLGAIMVELMEKK